MKTFSVRFNHPKNTWEGFSQQRDLWLPISVEMARLCFDKTKRIYVKGLP